MRRRQKGAQRKRRESLKVVRVEDVYVNNRRWRFCVKRSFDGFVKQTLLLTVVKVVIVSLRVVNRQPSVNRR